MTLLLDSIAMIAVVLPLVMILISLITIRNYRKGRIEAQLLKKMPNEASLSDPSKEILVSVFVAKKAVRETIRVILERYQGGLSELKNPPEEAEFLSQQILFAIHNLQSNSISDVMSSLHSLSALGTRNLLAILEEDLNLLERRWQFDSRTVRMIQMTRQRMSGRLEGRRKIGMITRTAGTKKQPHQKQDKNKEPDIELVY